MQLRRSLAALSLCLLSAPAALAEDDDHSTVSVFLPFYSENWWKDMHGSIISEDDEKTEYTIFCPTETPRKCSLAGETPFTFTEGPSTLIFHETISSTYTMNLECDLEAKTAATCSGYSSLKSGHVAGTNTGPTEITWRSTFTGPEVVWAAITLTDEVPEETTDGLLVDLTVTSMETPVETGDEDEDEDGDGDLPDGFPSEDSILPQETGVGEGAAAGRNGRWGVVAGAAGVLAGALL